MSGRFTFEKEIERGRTVGKELGGDGGELASEVVVRPFLVVASAGQMLERALPGQRRVEQDMDEYAKRHEDFARAGANMAGVFVPEPLAPLARTAGAVAGATTAGILSVGQGVTRLAFEGSVGAVKNVVELPGKILGSLFGF